MKRAFASVQFTAITAIKKAFSLFQHLTSQLMHSFSLRGGMDANAASPPLAPATITSPTLIPSPGMRVSAQFKDPGPVDAT